ncbi:Protein CBG27821 [Caenorhabditis briggsae]|uniref:Protein CBG27821 n=1 Tax=Caenorhabditis briggsae TaxID=6238 RepID=B6IKA3_CAEBR|nr:Protein CBG27821 [Caenorhabditis briggsae]CAS00333.1 Protein CBG27821 [Caenorhabditis briggsae]
MPRRRIKMEIKEERPDTPKTPVTPIAPAPFVLPPFDLSLAGTFQAGPLLFQQFAEQARHIWNDRNQPLNPALLNNFPNLPFSHIAGVHAVHPIAIQNIAAFKLPVMPLFQCRESVYDQVNRAFQDVFFRQPGISMEELARIIFQVAEKAKQYCISTGDDLNLYLKVTTLYALYKEARSRGAPLTSVSQITRSTVEMLKLQCPTDVLPYFSDLSLIIGICEPLEPPMCEWKKVKIFQLQEAIINTIYGQLQGVHSDEQLPALTYLPFVVRLFREFGLPMNDTYQTEIIDRLKRNLPHISPHYWDVLSSEIKIMLNHGCNPNFLPVSG